MTFEQSIYALITPLCARVFPDIAPTSTVKPYVTYQQIGGPVLNPLDGADPGREGITFQVNVWSSTRKEAKALIKQIEAALRPAPFNARPEAAAFNDYDHDMEVYGSQQEFSVWV